MATESTTTPKQANLRNRLVVLIDDDTEAWLDRECKRRAEDGSRGQIVREGLARIREGQPIDW